MKLAKGFAALGCVTQLVSSQALAMTGGETIPRSTHPESVYITAMTAQCTGTLIAPRFVLTAAHCLEKVEAHPSFVRLISVYRDEKNKMEVSRYFIHESEDLALLELSRASLISPATLIEPAENTSSLPSDCTVVGYGTPYNKNGRYQDALDGTGVAIKREGHIKLSGKKDQYLATRPTQFWIRRFLPFATKHSPVQITQGDSGGPLFCAATDQTTSGEKIVLSGVSIQSLESYWLGGGGRFFKSQSFFLDLSQPAINQWVKDHIH